MRILKRKEQLTQTHSVSECANILQSKIENRADMTVDDLLLSALIGRTTLSRELALNIPSLSAGIGFIADMVSMIPLKLYFEKEGKIEEIKDDSRLKLFNDDSGDTLDSVQFWRAFIFDYYLGKGAFAYLNKSSGQLESVHYVDERYIAIQKNNDPIFKDYNILVNGKSYKPFEFLKILRNSKDGAEGVSILEEYPYLLSVCYNMLKFEDSVVKKGAVRDGFLESDHNLSQEVVDAIQDAWQQQYSNNDKSTAIVLNEGIKFNAASLSSVELQLNENKQTNAREVCKILHIAESVLSGNATERDYINSINNGVMPLLRAIECAMNRDVLLEKEKSSKYWMFDTKELTKGDIKARYEAYKLGIDSNFIGIDEVRYKEDLPALGIDWIKLGLDSVLYNPKTGEIYTPNTNQSVLMDESNIKTDLSIIKDTNDEGGDK